MVKIVAVGVNKYGTTPFNVARGGVFTSLHSRLQASEERKRLLALNETFAKGVQSYEWSCPRRVLEERRGR